MSARRVEASAALSRFALLAVGARRVQTAAALGLFALLALPGAAEACAVCFQAQSDGSRIAFIVSTAAMTALPLMLVGGVAWWVRKRFRDAAQSAVGGNGAPSSARPGDPQSAAARHGFEVLAVERS